MKTSQAAMDCGSSASGLKMLLQVLLLASGGVLRLHGDPSTVAYHNLQCVNDYLNTINCTLRIQQPDSRSSYWLTFTEIPDRTVFTCPLKSTGEEFSCSLTTYTQKPEDDEDDYEDDYEDDCRQTFYDQSRYEMSLCHRREEGSDVCERLGDKYNPALNIKPNAPSHFAVRVNSSRRLFTWTSTYEPCLDVTALPRALQYQLRYYGTGHARDVPPRNLHTNEVNCSVDNENFVPNTKYAARVRSSPNQEFFKGHWSDWSPEVYWETQPAVKKLPSNTLFPGLAKVLVPLGVVASFALLFCYAPVKKWSRGSFVPTPTLYFPTPNSDCQGDFKSWAVTEANAADMLKAEEILQIDTFTECDVPEEEQEEQSLDQFHHRLTEGSVYNNISSLGVPYAVSCMAPSPTEGDSGCWLEKCPMYCNEYCTLSTLQEGLTGGAGRRGGPCNHGLPAGEPLLKHKLTSEVDTSG